MGVAVAQAHLPIGHHLARDFSFETFNDYTFTAAFVENFIAIGRHRVILFRHIILFTAEHGSTQVQPFFEHTALETYLIDFANDRFNVLLVDVSHGLRVKNVGITDVGGELVIQVKKHTSVGCPLIVLRLLGSGLTGDIQRVVIVPFPTLRLPTAVAAANHEVKAVCRVQPCCDIPGFLTGVGARTVQSGIDVIELGDRPHVLPIRNLVVVLGHRETKAIWLTIAPF
ncbi:hypothetical protein D3C80_970390 [compost metagenome]